MSISPWLMQVGLQGDDLAESVRLAEEASQQARQATPA